MIITVLPKRRFPTHPFCIVPGLSTLQLSEYYTFLEYEFLFTNSKQTWFGFASLKNLIQVHPIQNLIQVQITDHQIRGSVGFLNASFHIFSRFFVAWPKMGKSWIFIPAQNQSDFWTPCVIPSHLGPSRNVRFFPRKMVRFWTVGPTEKFIYQKLSTIENGVSERFLHFVWTRVNWSKLEPVVQSTPRGHQKNYFFMPSNFCFINFFG